MVPYDQDGFGARIVPVHLDGNNDQASMRPELVSAYVGWIIAQGHVPRRVLHPMCGPGLFIADLIRAGCERYLGVDANPHALTEARRALSLAELQCGDYRSYLDARHGERFDLVLFTYEGINTLCPEHLLQILGAARRRLTEQGQVVFDVRAPARRRSRRSWNYCPHGSIFRDAPHILLDEYLSGKVVGNRFHIIDLESLSWVDTVDSFLRPYAPREIRTLAKAAGFSAVDLQQGVLPAPHHRRLFVRLRLFPVSTFETV
jgi:hypothetical protein